MALSKYDKTNPLQPCRTTGGLVTTQELDQLARRGGLYSVTVFDLAVIDTGTISLGMTIPTGIEIIIKSATARGFGWPFKMSALMYESFTPSVTYKTPNNHLVIAGSIASLCTVNVNPTGWTPSDQFATLFGGGTAVAGQGSSGTESFGTDYILGAGTHVLIGENLTGSTAEMQLSLTWVEFYA